MSKLTNKVALSIVAQHLQNTATGETMDIKVNDTIYQFSPTEVIDKLNGMIAQLDKKADAPKRPTKTQIENVGYKAIVLEVLESAGRPVTVSELQAMDERISPANKFSNQKVASLLRSLEADGAAVKETIGRKTTYRVA